METTTENNALTCLTAHIELEDGIAVAVGDGIVAVDQIDDTLPSHSSLGGETVQRVILTRDDLLKLLELAG